MTCPLFSVTAVLYIQEAARWLAVIKTNNASQREKRQER